MTRIILILSISLLLVGCGGGTSSTSSGFDTGIASSRQLSTLNKKESADVCDKTVKYVDKFFTKKNICNLISVMTNISDFGGDPNKPFDVNKCESDKQKCLSEDFDSGDVKVECTNTEVVQKCDVSIDLYEKCINEAIDAFNDIFEKASCTKPVQAVADQYETTIDGNYIQTPSCVELQAECPDIFN